MAQTSDRDWGVEYYYLRHRPVLWNITICAICQYWTVSATEETAWAKTYAVNR